VPGVTPVFVATVRTWATRISGAESSLSAPTVYETLVTGAAEGTRIDRINMRAVGAVTDGMIRFYLMDPGDSSIYLLHEVIVVDTTPSGTDVAWWSEWVPSDGQPLVLLAEDWQLLVATENAESFDVLASAGGDF